MARVGQEIYGDWKKLSVLGSGGFGQVSLWENVNNGTKIAIKMCKQQLRERSLERWIQEVEIMKNMKHESIVGFHEVPEVIQNNYVINYVALGMEYCEKGDLRRMLSQAKNCCGIQEFQVRDFLNNIGSAIHFLHGKNIVHRDLKPENIVMKGIGKDRFQFKIIDLGYAKELSDQSVGTSFVGTLHYLAPEFSSVQPLRYTKTVDFWSFGLVAFECITGRRPFFPHLEAMQFVSILREKKADEHICTVGDDHDPNPRFLSHIPQPHALNPLFANKVEVWLQKMLLMDAARRGGGNGKNGWFESLQEMLAEKHINVYNTQTYSMITIPASEDMTVFTMQKQLCQRTNIPVDSQVLLLKSGDRPDVREPAVKGCWRPPSNASWNVYLYNISEEASRASNPTTPKSSQVPNLSLPEELKSIMKEERMRLIPKKMRRILCLAINFVDRECQRCLESMFALRAVKASVQKHYNHLISSGEELRMAYYKFMGVVEFFEKSLKTDVACYEEQERNHFSDEDDRLINEWTHDESAIEQYKGRDLPAIKTTIDNVFSSRINVVPVVGRTDDFCQKTAKWLGERMQQSSKKYDELKKKIRHYQDNDATRVVEDIHSTMRDLVLNFVRPIKEEIAQYYAEAGNRMRILLTYLRELRKMMGETSFEDKRRQLNSNMATLSKMNTFRQNSIWNIIRKLKADAEEMCRIMNIASESAHVENINDAENTESIRLTDEMDHNMRQFQRCIKDLTEDGSVDEINSLNWDSIFIDLTRKTQPVTNTIPHHGDAPPQVAHLNANANNNNGRDTIELSQEVIENPQTSAAT